MKLFKTPHFYNWTEKQIPTIEISAEPSNHNNTQENNSPNHNLSIDSPANQRTLFQMGGSDDDEYRPDVDEEQNFDGDFNGEEFMWNPDLNSGLFTRFFWLIFY